MSEAVISVRVLSKQYRLGAREKQADTFFEAAKNIITAPFKNYKQIRNLTRNNSNDDTTFWALRDVNFDVPEGQVMGIIGHNGAGKSTLLKILSRITDPTSGEVMIRGRVSALLEVGTGFHPELTGRENVYMNGTILGMSKKEIDQKFDEIVEFSGVMKHLDTPVKFYSSGMKVRLGFSVAAHLEPEILIIDEVLAVGDASFQKKCLGKMDAVAQGGRTVLFVSHNLNAIKNMCPKSILLQQGRLVSVAETTRVIDQYLKSTELLTTKIYKPEEGISKDGHVKLTSVSLSRQKISIEDAFIVTVSFAVPVDLTVDTNINLFFKAEDGIVAFTACSDVYRLKNGKYEVQFFVPPMLLNSIRYSVDIMVVHNASAAYKEFAVVSFEIDDVERLGWMGRIPGILRPLINTKLVSHEV